MKGRNMIQRRDKASKTDMTMVYIIIGLVVVIGGGGGIYMVNNRVPAIDPALHNADKTYLMAKTYKDVDPTQSMELKTNDPDFNTYQIWQRAKNDARKDLETALARVESTIASTPDLKGDAYFTMAQCVDYSMEIPLYGEVSQGRPPAMSKDEMKAKYDREFSYYDKAIEAYQQPGARTLLGTTRNPESQLSKIKDQVIPDKTKIREWYYNLATH